MKRWAHSSLTGGVGVSLNFLQEKDCEKIHEASLEVLKDRGVSFGSEKAREVLRDNGCWEDSEGCTHFPRHLVEDMLEAVPSEFVHYGRTEEDDIHMAQDQVYASNFGEGIYTLDMNTGERRSTIKQDAVDIVRVVDALDNVHIYNRAIGPQDVPSESASMHNAEVAFCYTSKPMHLVSSSPFQTKKMIQMAEVAAGGKEELKKRPRTAFNHTTISPLRISEEACENAMIVSEAGLPNHILVMVQQGGHLPHPLCGQRGGAQCRLPGLQHPDAVREEGQSHLLRFFRLRHGHEEGPFARGRAGGLRPQRRARAHVQILQYPQLHRRWLDG